MFKINFSYEQFRYPSFSLPCIPCPIFNFFQRSRSSSKGNQTISTLKNKRIVQVRPLEISAESPNRSSLEEDRVSLNVKNKPVAKNLELQSILESLNSQFLDEISPLEQPDYKNLYLQSEENLRNLMETPGKVEKTDREALQIYHQTLATLNALFNAMSYGAAEISLAKESLESDIPLSEETFTYCLKESEFLQTISDRAYFLAENLHKKELKILEKGSNHPRIPNQNPMIDYQMPLMIESCLYRLKAAKAYVEKRRVELDIQLISDYMKNGCDPSIKTRQEILSFQENLEDSMDMLSIAMEEVTHRQKLMSLSYIEITLDEMRNLEKTTNDAISKVSSL